MGPVEPLSIVFGTTSPSTNPMAYKKVTKNTKYAVSPYKNATTFFIVTLQRHDLDCAFARFESQYDRLGVLRQYFGSCQLCYARNLGLTPVNRGREYISHTA